MTGTERRLLSRARALEKRHGAIQKDWGLLGIEARDEGLFDWLANEVSDTLSPATLASYTDTVAAFPGDKWKDELSFAVHAEVAGLAVSERQKILSRIARKKPPNGERWTRAAVRLELGRRTGHEHSPVAPDFRPAPESPEVRAARVASDLNDPEVRRAVERDDTARETLYHATADMTRRKVEDNKETYRRVAPDTVSMETTMHLARQTRMYRRVVVESLTELSHHSLSDDEKEVLMDQVTELNDVLGWLTTYLSSGDTSWDEALAALQEGEQ